jgi:hypothetical protein
MGQERWDVVLRALGGPLARQGDLTYRGPVIRLGASPGAGGVQLTGYRGLDPRQAVLTAYDGGSVSIAPVGAAQVRVAPHQNVRWEDLDPIPGPQYLHPGCAVHLGPVGRGVTLLFVAANKLGAWDDSGISSHLSEAPTLISDGPTSEVAPRVNLLRVESAPAWFVGCFGLLSLAISASSLLYVHFDPPDVEPLGPQVEGEEYLEFGVIVDKDALKRIPHGAKEGLKSGFWKFVMKDNVLTSGRTELEQVENWDARLFEYVGMTAKQVSKAKVYWRRLQAVKDDYGYVVSAMREAGLPEVFAGIPYLESRYRAEIQSYACGKGWWQFMPEVAKRMEVKSGLDFSVRGCRFEGDKNISWEPTAIAPPSPIKDAQYIRLDGEYMQCRIPQKRGCKVDDRADLERSTAAAVAALREAYEDELLRASGAIVQMTIASHNAGYHDARFGVKKSFNILPAYKKWRKKNRKKDPSTFIGETIKCEKMEKGKSGSQWCGSVLVAQTQHYAYGTIAYHMLAACFYGKNYGDMSEFEHYGRMYNATDSYCTNLNIPDLSEI